MESTPGVQKTSNSNRLRPYRTCGRVKAGVTCCPRWVSLIKNYTAISDNAM